MLQSFERMNSGKGVFGFRVQNRREALQISDVGLPRFRAQVFTFGDVSPVFEAEYQEGS